MKFKDIILTANSNLGKSKLRTALTVLAVFIGALTLCLTNGVGDGIRGYINVQLGNVGAADALIVQASTDSAFDTSSLSSDTPKKYDPETVTSTNSGQTVRQKFLNQSDIDTIAAQSGIKSVEPYYTIPPDYVTGGTDAEKYQVEVSQMVDGLNIDIQAGRAVAAETDNLETTIPFNYVTALGFSNDAEALGQTITYSFTGLSGQVYSVDATIVGIQRKSLLGSGAYVSKSFNKTAYATYRQGLPASEEQYSYVVAKFDTSYSEDQLTQLKSQLQEKGYSAQTVDDQLGTVKQVIDAVVIVFNVFGVIALLAASFGIINTLFMAVQERTREIGLMKALGMKRSRIFYLFSLEAVLIGFWGSVLGVVAANGIGRILNRIASNSFLKDFDGLNLLSFPAKSVLIIMGIIMAISFLAGTLPARRASRKDPIEALRYE